MSSITSDNLKTYLNASIMGALRGLVGLPVEHPFDTIKTRCQASPHLTSVVQVTQTIYKSGGIAGFYSGAIPNGTRAAIKQMYRWPMMIGLPPVFKEILPSSIQKKDSSAAKTATGLTIASFESFVICPLERLKVYLMTSEQEEKSIVKFCSANRGKLTAELTRGLTAVYFRQIASWVSFLVSDEKIKNWERTKTHTSHLSFFSLMKVCFLVGGINTIANMPFDVIKTNLQKRKFIKSESVFKVMQRIYQSHGVRGLYAGWQVRMVQYMIQSAFTVTLLDKFEASMKKNANASI